MRENLYNSSVYMIYTGDLLEKIYKRLENPNITKEEREKLRNCVTSIKEFQTVHGFEITEIAIDRTNPFIDVLIEGEVITKQKIQNALSFAILSNAKSKDELEKMYVDIYLNDKISYEESIEKYGKKVTNYILRNCDFDYNDSNKHEKHDNESFYLSEDLKLSREVFAPLNTNHNLTLLFTKKQD